MATKQSPEFVLEGSLCAAEDWEAVSFEAENGEIDTGSVALTPVACFAVCRLARRKMVCGLVQGPDELEPAEVDENFRGYIKRAFTGDLEQPLRKFLSSWLENQRD